FDEPADFSEVRAVSICLEGSRLRSLACYGLRVEDDLDCAAVMAGSIDVFGAHIGGRFWLQGAQLHSSDGSYALNAPDLTVGGGMYCRGIRATGGVNLYGATIGATLEFAGATLSNPEGTALRAPGSVVRADMTCTDGFAAAGAIDLSGARIGGELRLAAATFTSTTADLRKADIRVLSGEPSSWPGQLRLNELTYTALEP